MVKINEKELKELFIELKYNNIAFEKLYNKYNKLVYGIAFSILKNKQDSEDVVQNIFTKIYNIDKDNLPTKNEASWLYSTTKHETITVLRKRKNDLDLDSIYEIEDQDNEIDNSIDKMEFNGLIRKLDNCEKEIVSLKILANLSFDEIGKLLNKPTGTIKWRYYKAMNTLKILLSNLGMFIVTFIIWLKTLSNQQKVNNAEQQIITDENIVQNEENIEQEKTEQDKSTMQDSLKEENNNINEEIVQNTIKQETIISDTIIEDNINYFGIGILSVSAIFLVFTIIFMIIFTKYQLKLKKKTSK